MNPNRDPTRGRRVGDGTTADPTQGRRLGADRLGDPTQGRAIGSDRCEDPTAVRDRRRSRADWTSELVHAVRTGIVTILILPNGQLKVTSGAMSFIVAVTSAQAWPAAADPVIAYAEWRMSCTAVWTAYGQWSNASIADADLAHAAYIAALDREGAAARAYSELVTAHAPRS
jgi:hypothetical protein